MEWKTRLTEVIGTKYPIIQGSFAGFGDSRLATAVSEAGGLGMITAGVSNMSPFCNQFTTGCSRQ